MCAWVGVGLCDCFWQGTQGSSLCCPAPLHPAASRTHIRCHGCGRAVEMGGWGGGSKIKLKIKACPESPSAPRGRQGGTGIAAAPPLLATGAEACLSICPQPYLAPAWPCSPRPQALLLPWVDQQSMGPGGRQGQDEIKGTPREGQWD